MKLNNGRWGVRVTAALACTLFAFPVSSEPDDAPKGGSGATADASQQPVKKKKVELKKHFPTKQLEKGEDVKWTHAPYNVGKCSLCHESDNREKPGPMRASVNTICLSCHTKEKSTFTQKKKVHEPVGKDCGYCHNAHDSKYKALLYRPKEELCIVCHEDQKQELLARVQHEPVIQQKRCDNCHDSHAANEDNLLIEKEGPLCVDCHGGRNQPVKDEKGRVLINIQAMQQRKITHEPFAKDKCSSCHNPHGSPYFRLLKGNHPADFYAAYNDAQYGLCYQCHKKERITTAETTELTGFRDGNKNLHYRHVVQPRSGRTCRSCHDDHATDNPHLIRSAVPYGTTGWELPLAYTETNNGGRCAKTCHDNATYNNRGVRPRDIARDAQ